ncbi:MAG: hypothetical protein AAFY76_00680 [Cyanobacteria bacterium J06649_11]
MSQEQEANALIRFIGKEMENSEVPVDILVRVLTGLQKIIYLLVTAREKGNINQRFRVATEIQKTYRLKTGISQAGSYIVPINIEPDNTYQTSLLASPNDVIENLEYLFSSVKSHEFTRIQDILPDSPIRNRVLRETSKLLPKGDESWKLGFTRNNQKPEITVSNKEIEIIDEWLYQDIPEDTITTVTGELIKIDFDKRLIALRYPLNHREIDCFYVEELEDSLIDNRRQMIQVTGTFTLDIDGHPIKLSNVTRIEPLDLSPIILREITWEDRIVYLKEPLQLKPELDEDTKQLLIATKPGITLHSFGYTREDLIHGINEDVIVMVDEYYYEDDEKLAPDALALKYKLHSIIDSIEEKGNATTEEES